MPIGDRSSTSAGGAVAGAHVLDLLDQHFGAHRAEYRLVADAKGAWSKYYMPFLWGRPGGTVTVSLQGARCTLSLTFDWVRDTGGSEARLGYAL